MMEFIVMISNVIISSTIQPILFRRAADEKEIEFRTLFLNIYCFGCICNMLLAIVQKEWRKWRKVKWKAALLGTSLCGPLGGPLPQNLAVLSFAFVSPKFASIVSDLVPGVIFFIDVVCRKKWSRRGTFMIQVLGIVLFPIVAAVIEGIMDNDHNLPNQPASSPTQAPAPMPLVPSERSRTEVVVWLLICIGSSANAAAWFTTWIQEKITPEPCCTFTMAAMMNFSAAVASGVYVACRDRDSEHYKLHLNTTVGLLVFISVFVSVLGTAGAAWCAERRSQSFVAAFSNVSLIVDKLAAPLLLGRKIELGSVLSFIILILGIRAFNWATKREAEEEEAAASVTVVDDQGEDDADHTESVASFLNFVTGVPVPACNWAIKRDAAEEEAAASVTVVDDQGEDNTDHTGSVQPEHVSIVSPTAGDQVIEVNEGTDDNDDDYPIIQESDDVRVDIEHNCESISQGCYEGEVQADHQEVMLKVNDEHDGVESYECVEKPDRTLA